MKLWLDDIREAPGDWEFYYFARTAPDAIRALQEFEDLGIDVDTISLDHDLGDDPEAGTGYDVLTWIEERVHTDPSYEPPILRVHSANPPARERMERAISAIEDWVSRGALRA